MCLILFSTEAFLIYNLAFLNLVPFYNCYDAKGIGRECSQIETCLPEFNYDLSDMSAAPFISGFRTNDEKQTVLRNWMQDLDLRCAEKW